MNIATVLIVVLIVLLVAGLPQVTAHNVGYWPSGIIGVALVVLLLLLIMGRI